MFMEDPVEEIPLGGGVYWRVASPQLGDTNVSPKGCGGVLFVTVIFKVSPGLTCNVGSCKPVSVIKQCSNLPAESVVC
jgi:hypothetical protein